MTRLRLAIVGAGPAGIYAADIILKAERKFDVSIDLVDDDLRVTFRSVASIEALVRRRLADSVALDWGACDV